MSRADRLSSRHDGAYESSDEATAGVTRVPSAGPRRTSHVGQRVEGAARQRSGGFATREPARARAFGRSTAPAFLFGGNETRGASHERLRNAVSAPHPPARVAAASEAPDAAVARPSCGPQEPAGPVPVRTARRAAGTGGGHAVHGGLRGQSHREYRACLQHADDRACQRWANGDRCTEWHRGGPVSQRRLLEHGVCKHRLRPKHVQRVIRRSCDSGRSHGRVRPTLLGRAVREHRPQFPPRDGETQGRSWCLLDAHRVAGRQGDRGRVESPGRSADVPVLCRRHESRDGCRNLHRGERAGAGGSEKHVQWLVARGRLLRTRHARRGAAQPHGLPGICGRQQ